MVAGLVLGLTPDPPFPPSAPAGAGFAECRARVLELLWALNPALGGA